MLLYINLFYEYQIRGPYMQDKGGKGAGPLASIIAKDVLLLQSFLNRIYWIHLLINKQNFKTNNIKQCSIFQYYDIKYLLFCKRVFFSIITTD